MALAHRGQRHERRQHPDGRHGNDRGLHLYVGDTANAVFLEAEIWMPSRFNLEGTRTDASAQETLKMKAGPFSELKALVRKVQALALDRVDVPRLQYRTKGRADEPAAGLLQLQYLLRAQAARQLRRDQVRAHQQRSGLLAGVAQETKNVTIKGVSPDRFALSRDFTGGVNPAGAGRVEEGDYRLGRLLPAAVECLHRRQPAALSTASPI